MTLHKRIAEALNWPLEDVQSFSLHALREILGPDYPKLAHEVTCRIRSGDILRDPEDDPRLAPVANLLRDYFRSRP